MNQKMKTWIRDKASQYPNPSALHMTRAYRGYVTGAVSEVIKAAAGIAGLPVSNAREIRLTFASQVFDQKTYSFNDLNDQEMWALGEFVKEHRAIPAMAEWLKERYGEQRRLM